MWLRSRQIDGEQQRERNGERNDDRAAHVAEEQKENDRDQDHALGQIVFHGLTVYFTRSERSRKGTTLTPLGKNAVVELLHLFVNALQHRVGVVALLQQHDAFHSVGIVDDCAIGAMGGAADLAEANLRTLRHGARCP